MPLLVVPLAADDTGLLPFGELQLLMQRDRVLFDVAGHPLMQYLEGAGIACSVLGEMPRADDPSSAVVLDPASLQVIELAKAGAEVRSGAETPDALTAAHAASLRGPVARLASVAAVMARLRSEDGCPWDIEQTHASLLPHLSEEAEEVAEAVDAGTLGDELADELGDVLLQVLFHARIAEGDGRFDLGTVAETLSAKLVRRHPHVFGDTEVESAGDVVRNWEAIKRTERKGAG